VLVHEFLYSYGRMKDISTYFRRLCVPCTRNELLQQVPIIRYQQDGD